MLAYTVTATTTDPAEAERFIDWLAGDPDAGRTGHAADVVEAGGISAQIVRVEGGPGEPIRVECRYVFESAEEFARYEQGPAVPLRAEGKELFPPDGPLKLGRSVGEVVIEAGLAR
ncbi:MAG: hypothetical protein RIE77_14780 [Phycisphaerales bacterium]|jgi:hypothetical protein